MRSGFTDINIGRFRLAATNSYGWTSRSDSVAANSFYLGFNNLSLSSADSSRGYGRWLAIPLRCLSTV